MYSVAGCREKWLLVDVCVCVCPGAPVTVPESVS